MPAPHHQGKDHWWSPAVRSWLSLFLAPFSPCLSYIIFSMTPRVYPLAPHSLPTPPRQRSSREPSSVIFVVSFPSTYLFLPPLYHFSYDHSGSSFDQALPPTTTEPKITNEAQQCGLGCVFSFHLSLLASFISLFLWPLPLFLHHREQRSPWKCGSATLYLQLAIDSVHSASEKIV